ncbi:MAG TPA: PQQ-binding-like beta-propeller repeat protein [Pyrinomonadaceae bacterium]|jgi:outer membrane protein assembly factor BamB
MNNNPRPNASRYLLIVLSLVLCAAATHAQRRAPAKTGQRKGAQAKPTQTPAKTEPSPAKPGATPGAAADQPQATASGKQVMIRWRGRAGVNRYRLQVARDRDFRDIVFDRAVVGLEAQVELPPGDNFFWRVAPAAQETGEYSAPTPVGMAETAPGAAENAGGTGQPAGVLRSPTDVGWQALTGEVLRPQGALLRGPNTPDIIAVNTDGMVFALDGTSGAALWSARYRPQARAGDPPARPAALFTPVFVHPAEGAKALVVAAFDGGVRALEGETGRELWRARLDGAALNGVAADLDDDKIAAELAVATDEPALYFFDARSGRQLSKQKLDGALVGGPVPFLTPDARGVALSLAGGMIDVRKADGSRFRAVRFDVGFTTPPMVISSANGALVVVGTEHGMLFLNGTDMQPLGKITTEDDSPRGRLGGADLNHDGVAEIVALMKSGKVIMVNATGHIAWSAPGATGAYGPLFADLNGDGTLDVLVASERTFAAGYDGRNGALLWQVDDPKPGAATTGSVTGLRALTIIFPTPERALIVGGDAARSAVRAVGLPLPALKTAAK